MYIIFRSSQISATAPNVRYAFERRDKSENKIIIYFFFIIFIFLINSCNYNNDGFIIISNFTNKKLTNLKIEDLILLYQINNGEKKQLIFFNGLKGNISVSEQKKSTLKPYIEFKKNNVHTLTIREEDGLITFWGDDGSGTGFKYDEE